MLENHSRIRYTNVLQATDIQDIDVCIHFDRANLLQDDRRTGLRRHGDGVTLQLESIVDIAPFQYGIVQIDPVIKGNAAISKGVHVFLRQSNMFAIKSNTLLFQRLRCHLRQARLG